MFSIKRYNSIDILRALAIIGMIQVHFAEILSGYYERTTLLYELSDIFGSLPAPLFTFLVGMSLYISVKRQEEAGKPELAIADRNLRRGTQIFFFGLIFAALIWTPAEVFGWDILTLIGAALLIVFPLRKLKDNRLVAIILLIVIASPLLRIWSNYYSHWNQWGEFVPATSLKSVLLGFTLNGYFPLLPWLIFPLCGYLVSRACFGNGQPHLPKFIVPTGIGLVLAALGLALIETTLDLSAAPAIGGYLSPLSFYPASTTYLALTLGIIFLLFTLTFRFFDQNNNQTNDSAFIRFCRRYSRYALSAYIIHHAVVVWPVLAAANISGKRDIWFYYGDVVPTYLALIIALVFVALFYLVLIWWDKKDGRYSFEWLLRRLTG